MTPLVLLCLLLVLVDLGVAQLKGELRGTLAPSTHRVVGNIRVAAGDTLRVSPGTTFLFAGPYSLQVFGTLLAEGVGGDSVVFTVAPGRQTRPWKGLHFQAGSSGSRLAYCIIEQAMRGKVGGIFCKSSSPSFVGCTIRGNSSGNSGGGVACLKACPTFDHCTFTGNTSKLWGGGAYCFDSSPVFTNCTFESNTAKYGGAMCCLNNSSPEFSVCVFRRNSAVCGGAVACRLADGAPRGSSVNLTRCLFQENRAEAGAGLYVGQGSGARATQCTFYALSAEKGAGVYCAKNAGLHLTSSCLARAEGVALYVADMTCVVNIVWCDFFDNSRGPWFHGQYSWEGTREEIERQQMAALLPLPGPITAANAQGDSCDVHQNIFLDPRFLNASAGDFHLQQDSPCIDAGDPSLPRDPDGTVADIGAFSYDGAANKPPAGLPGP